MRGSAVKTPSTSVQISQTSALSAAASATAVVSDPPRPRVVTSLVCSVTPWNPATIATLPESIAWRIRLALTSMIRALPWDSSVITPACWPVNDWACTPRLAIAIASSDIEIRSPAVSRMSISRAGGIGVIWLARSISSSVVSPIAETTTTTSSPAREMDILLTAGERISMSLLAMAIANLGVHAQSFTGQQAGVITDESHGKARIIDVKASRIRQAIDSGNVAIVAGFQGVTEHTNDVTTLGRGGSDTTAVALAAALKADVCEIYTDVDGVFTADPRIVPTARKLDRITYEE